MNYFLLKATYTGATDRSQTAWTELIHAGQVVDAILCLVAGVGGAPAKEDADGTLWYYLHSNLDLPTLKNKLSEAFLNSQIIDFNLTALEADTNPEKVGHRTVRSYLREISLRGTL